MFKGSPTNKVLELTKPLIKMLRLFLSIFSSELSRNEIPKQIRIAVIIKIVPVKSKMKLSFVIYFCVDNKIESGKAMSTTKLEMSLAN